MRKLITVSVALLALGSISCKKCQTCTTTTSQEVPGAPPITTSTSQEYCGKEYDNAPAESSVTQEVFGIQQTVTIDCVDN